MTLKMTSAQVVETSVNVNNNSSFQSYTNPDDHTRQTTETSGFKPFTKKYFEGKNKYYKLLIENFYYLCEEHWNSYSK